MKIYIQQKFYLAVVKSFAIGGAFAVLEVDLWVLWTILTFLMNFMPLGSAISTLAPIPFVILDPEKGIVDIAICILLPILVHNFVGNVVEPRLFAISLALHP